MEEPQAYKLYIQPRLKVALALGFIAFAGIGVALLLPSIIRDSQAPPLLVGVMFLVILLFSLWWILSLPSRITLAADGTVEFISRWRQWTVRAEEIRSLKPEGSHLGFLVVRTDRGKIRILAQFDGFHDFLTRLKARHPTVELRGC